MNQLLGSIQKFYRNLKFSRSNRRESVESRGSNEEQEAISDESGFRSSRILNRLLSVTTIKDRRLAYVGLGFAILEGIFKSLTAPLLGQVANSLVDVKRNGFAGEDEFKYLPCNCNHSDESITSLIDRLPQYSVGQFGSSTTETSLLFILLALLIYTSSYARYYCWLIFGKCLVRRLQMMRHRSPTPEPSSRPNANQSIGGDHMELIRSATGEQIGDVTSQVSLLMSGTIVSYLSSWKMSNISLGSSVIFASLSALVGFIMIGESSKNVDSEKNSSLQAESYGSIAESDDQQPYKEQLDQTQLLALSRQARLGAAIGASMSILIMTHGLILYASTNLTEGATSHDIGSIVVVLVSLVSNCYAITKLCPSIRTISIGFALIKRLLNDVEAERIEERRELMDKSLKKRNRDRASRSLKVENQSRGVIYIERKVSTKTERSIGGVVETKEFSHSMSRQYSITFHESIEQPLQICTDLEMNGPSSSSMKEFLQLFRPEWIWLGLGAMASLLFGILLPLYALLNAQILDIYTNSDQKFVEMGSYWSLVFIGYGFIIGLSWFSSKVVSSYAVETAAHRLMLEYHCNPRGLSNSQVNEAIYRVKSILTDCISTIMTVVSSLTISILCILYLGWQMALVAIPSIPLLMYVTHIKTKSSRQQYGSHLQDQTSSDLKKESDDSWLSEFRGQTRRAALFQGLTSGSSNLILALAFRWGAYLIVQDQISPIDVFRVTTLACFSSLVAARLVACQIDQDSAETVTSISRIQEWQRPKLDHENDENDQNN